MKTLRHFVVAVIICTAAFVIFHTIKGKGEWIADFSSEDGNGVIVFSMTADADKRAKIIFINQQRFAPLRVNLRNEKRKFQYGEVTFSDTTVLPGRAIMEVEGHKIDIMTRAIIIDGVEHAWSPNLIIKLPDDLPGAQLRRLPHH